MSDDVGRIRTEIDATDREILAAVNRRLRLVAELWELKRTLQVDRLDPGREQALRAGLASENDGPLSDAGLQRLVDALLALTKDELADA